MCKNDRKQQPIRPRVVIRGILVLMAFACTACVGAQSWAQGRCEQITAEGDNGSIVRLSINDRAGLISITNPGTGLGTLIPIPLQAFFALAREISGAPSHLPSLHVIDTEQTLLAMPVTIKDGIGGVIMVKVTRVSGSLGAPHPMLALYAKRGDEKWDNEVRFSNARLNRLVSEASRFFTN